MLIGFIFYQMLNTKNDIVIVLMRVYNENMMLEKWIAIIIYQTGRTSEIVSTRVILLSSILKHCNHQDCKRQ